MYSIRTVVHAVEYILESHRSEMAAAMAIAGLPKGFGSILPYFSHNIDVKMFPCLMVDQRSDASEWIAMPNISADVVRLSIWGMIHWDHPEQSAEAIGLLGSTVKLILNRQHRAFQIDDTHDLYFEDSAPVSSVEYGLAEMNTAVVKAFQASFSSKICVQLRSES